MTKLFPRYEFLSSEPGRPGAGVDLRQFIDETNPPHETFKAAALLSKFDLRNSMNDSNGHKIKGAFVHLSDLTMMASVPAKSSAHAQIAQVVKTVANNFLDAGVTTE